MKLIYARFNTREIMFKPNTDKGESNGIDELRKKHLRLCIMKCIISLK